MNRFKVKNRYISRKNLISFLKDKWPNVSEVDFRVKMINDVLKYSAPVQLTDEEIKEKQIADEMGLPEPESNVFATSTNSHMDLLIFAESADPVLGTRQILPLSTRVINEHNLRMHLSRANFKTRLAIISQPYSWAPLQVSMAMFRLFTTLTNAMEEIWDLALSFRHQTSDIEIALSTCAWKRQNGLREISYVFKYPEKKYCDDNGTIWVIRQSGLYHQYNSESEQSTWMLVFPNNKSFSTEKIVNIMTLGQHPLQPHICFHFAHLHQWRWYMADLEKQFQELAGDVLNVEIEEKLDFAKMYKQLSSLRFIETNLSPLVPIFTAHYRVLGMLKRLNNELLGGGEIGQTLGWEFAASLDSLEDRVQSLESNAKFLLSRVTSTIQMASDTISLKSQNTTEDMSNYMLRDSAAIRVITVVTLVYLPASFVAGFFGMGFFTTSDDANAMWTVAPYTWIYFAVAIPLSALTLAYWKWKSWQEGSRSSLTSPV